MNDQLQTWAVEDVSGKHRQLGAIAEYIITKCAENNLSTESLVLLLNPDDKMEIEAAVRQEEIDLWQKTTPPEVLYSPPPGRSRITAVWGILLKKDRALKPCTVHVVFFDCIRGDELLYEKAIGPLWFAIGDKDKKPMNIWSHLIYMPMPKPTLRLMNDGAWADYDGWIEYRMGRIVSLEDTGDRWKREVLFIDRDMLSGCDIQPGQPFLVHEYDLLLIDRESMFRYDAYIAMKNGRSARLLYRRRLVRQALRRFIWRGVVLLYGRPIHWRDSRENRLRTDKGPDWRDLRAVRWLVKGVK